MLELPVDYRKLNQAERRRVREEYVARQSGKCCYCHSPLDGPPSPDIACKRVTKRLFPKSFFKWPVHLHHDHVTGLTIGAVHCHCNAVSWEYDGV
jgi:hypothetical protein